MTRPVRHSSCVQGRIPVASRCPCPLDESPIRMERLIMFNCDHVDHKSGPATEGTVRVIITHHDGTQTDRLTCESHGCEAKSAEVSGHVARVALVELV